MENKSKKKGKNFKIHPLKYTLMELRKINYLKRNHLPIPSELKNRKFEHFHVDESQLKKKPVITTKRVSQPVQTTIIKTKGKKKIVKKVIIEEEIEESDDDSLPEGETQIIQTNEPNASLKNVIPDGNIKIEDNEKTSLIQMGEKK